MSRPPPDDHDWPEDEAGGMQRFSRRSKFNQQMKTRRTAARRLAQSGGEIADLPLGRVLQVHSLFCDVELDGQEIACVVRKTLQKVSDTRVVVGDLVRIRYVENPEPGAPQATVEHIEPRRTVLSRADSFKAKTCWPIVANADQMLIVASIVKPRVKWGLIDRMIVAARLGGLLPIVCLTKIDLVSSEAVNDVKDADKGDSINVLADAREKLAHYRLLGIETIESSIIDRSGIDRLREVLAGKVTVLAGHSGVGKSSLVRALDSSLDIKVGEVSEVTEKGKHTTTSARIYKLSAEGLAGAELVDTPGVKVFGLWGLDSERLDACYPDVLEGNAPDWRQASYERIAEALNQDRRR